MHSPPALAPAVAAARAQAAAFVGLAFRSIHLRHFSNFATVRPLHCAGGGAVGSRYVPPNGPPALYTSLDPHTAFREGNQLFYQTSALPGGQALVRAGGLRPHPVALIAVHVRVSRLLDLRDPATRNHLGILADAELLAPWLGLPNAPTQVLGQTIFNDGQFEGIVFPSAQSPGHDCLMLFRDRLLTTSRIHFFDTASGLAAQLP
jgi:RES domain-containing protein